MKLSGLQIFWLIFTFETGNIILLTVGPVMKEANQDIWISYLIASVLGVLIMYIAVKTALLYQKHTLIQYSKLILGKWLGTVMTLFYFVQWYAVAGNILREFTDFTISMLLPKTPSWVFFITMLFLLVYVTFIGGIEGIGRCAEVFGPIIIFSVVILTSFTIKEFDITNLLPIFVDTGLISIWKGALTPLSFLGESAVMMLMLVSFMDKPENAMKSAISGLVCAAIIVSIVAVCVLLVFGPEISGDLRHPAFDLVSYLSVMDFIQNLDIIGMLVWILSVFIKLSVYFFLSCYGTAQLLKIKDWKKVIWIVVIFYFMLAQFVPSISYTFGYMKTYLVYFVLPINMVGIPLLLWIVGMIRNRKKSPA
ncbi:endospore germination permease [Lederbergia wuyishanensis]|uniref:Spore germination protein KB n=1 Tax=Lederbergia wuyishanensis TaxID=1347903 RepID=A0ABU0D611_9BACI|nr:endospore germination permease [Lederbergia wuyishanensis]MCJ8008408.1 spore germination protein [Lederbergia wuyishanensis]MDQ0343825.1 spore germination protein KB [Lederbergia wuyishanensis]